MHDECALGSEAELTEGVWIEAIVDLVGELRADIVLALAPCL